MDDTAERMEGSSASGSSLRVISSGLAWIELGCPISGRLALGLDLLRSMDRHLDQVEAGTADGTIRSVVVASADAGPRLASYDLRELDRMSPEDGVEWSLQAQRILQRLEKLPVVTVAAIDGEWLGGAMEVALACRYRVAAHRTATRMGFPQLANGVLPGWGGSVRLPKLVGLARTARLILRGSIIRAPGARRIGLVDRLLPSDGFAARVERLAIRWAASPRARPRRSFRFQGSPLEWTTSGRHLILDRAGRRYLDPGTDDDPAAHALALLRDLTIASADTAYGFESRAFGGVLGSHIAQARLYSCASVNRLTRMVPSISMRIDTAAVLGSAPDAADLAHLLVTAGVAVRIKGSTREQVTRTAEAALRRIIWEADQGRITRSEAAAREASLLPVTAFGGFGTTDLAIASSTSPSGAIAMAVEAERHVGTDCILAIDGWTDSVERLAESLVAPGRAIAITASLPAHRFPLLEIVPHARTEAWVIDSIRTLARRLNLVPIVVSDRSPTPATRLLATYLDEASRLLDEGGTVEQIDGAARRFGMETGPFLRADAIGSQRAALLMESVALRLGRPRPIARLFDQVARVPATFYTYRRGRPSHSNPHLPEGIAMDGGSMQAIIERRIMLALLNEAAHCMADEAVGDESTLDAIAAASLGFPRDRGGPLYLARRLGLASVAADLARAADRYGDRFAPSDWFDRAAHQVALPRSDGAALDRACSGA